MKYEGLSHSFASLERWTFNHSLSLYWALTEYGISFSGKKMKPHRMMLNISGIQYLYTSFMHHSFLWSTLLKALSNVVYNGFLSSFKSFRNWHQLPTLTLVCYFSLNRTILCLSAVVATSFFTKSPCKTSFLFLEKHTIRWHKVFQSSQRAAHSSAMQRNEA